MCVCVIGRIASLGVEIDAVVARVPLCISIFIKFRNIVNLGASIPGANLGERDAPRFLFCVRWSGDGERDVEVYPVEQQERDEAGTQNETARMKVTGGGNPCARGRHAMETERRRHQF